MIECDVCGKSFSLKGIGSHKWRAHGAGVGFKPALGKLSWKKGKTAADDPRLRHSDATRELIRQGMTGKTLSDEHREKVRAAVERKRAEGTWHLSFSRARTHEYKGFKFHGKWEVEFAKYLDRLGVTWTRCIETTPYKFEGVQRHYTPDFYITDCDVYVEVKGYRTPKDDAKWSYFPKKLLVLRGEDLALLGLNIQYKSCS